jgi:hypothetical protein
VVKTLVSAWLAYVVVKSKCRFQHGQHMLWSNQNVGFNIAVMNSNAYFSTAAGMSHVLNVGFILSGMPHSQNVGLK